MKRIIVLFSFMLLLSSCSNSYNIERFTEVFGFNFTKYSNEGFLITPEGYNEEYESLGLIQLRLYPAVKRSLPAGDYDNYVKVSIGGNAHYIERITADMLLDSLYTEAKALGADAIINFKHTVLDETPLTKNYPKGIQVNSVSGLAIKRAK